MPIEELSLAVVGIGYPNADGSSRIEEIQRCTRGEAVELRLEPENPHDSRAVAVFSVRGVQIGYVTAERAGWIFARIEEGEPVEAVFQEILETAGVIRAKFGGDAPKLPRKRHGPPITPRGGVREPYGPPRDWYPDPEGPDWGA